MTVEETFDKWCDITQPMDLSVVKLLAITAMKEYTRLKCLEAIENTKNKVCEELESLVWPFSYNAKILNYPPTQLIRNISNQDVMPEL